MRLTQIKVWCRLGRVAIAGEGDILGDDHDMTAEHPFARFVATIGRGPGRSRSLDEAEAQEAMAMILAGEVEPEQLGAFLMLMRYRHETPAELAGLTLATGS